MPNIPNGVMTLLSTFTGLIRLTRDISAVNLLPTKRLKDGGTMKMVLNKVLGQLPFHAIGNAWLDKALTPFRILSKKEPHGSRVKSKEKMDSHGHSVQLELFWLSALVSTAFAAERKKI